MTNEMSIRQQAYKEIPKAWYEIQSPREIVYKLMPLSIAALFAVNAGSLYLRDEFPDFFTHYPLAPGLIAGTLFAISAIADHHSTIKAFESAQKGKEQGLPLAIREANPFLRNVKTADQMRRSKLNLAIQTGGIILSVLQPEVGIVLAGTKFLAVANNRRLARRYDRIRQIAQGR